MLQREQESLQHWLEIEDNQGKRTVVLEAATCTLGRDSTNTIVLHSMLVSRQHAILLRVTTPTAATHFFRIIDGNLQGKASTNGISVNNILCFSHDLEHGDVIVFAGDVRATYCNNVNLTDVNVSLSLQGKQASGSLATTISPIPNKTPSQRTPEISTESSLVRLASFPELLSIPILEINSSGTITYLNPAAVAQFPDIREAKLQHPILEGIVSTAKKGKEKFFVREVEVNSKFYEQSVHVIAQSDLIRSYIVDITGRKQTEQALRDSETKHRALLNAIPDLILRISEDGTYLDYIPAKDNETSISSCQMLGRNEYDVLPVEVAQQRMRYVRSALSTGKPQIFEYQLLVNNRIREEEARIVVSGKDEVLAIVRDITERKQVEALLQKANDELEIRVAQRTAQLSEANEQLRREIAERQRAEDALRSSVATNRALLNAIPDAIFRINKDGIFVNYKTDKDNNVPVFNKDFLGKNLYQVFPLEVAQPMQDCVEQALATNGIQVLEYQLLVNENLLDYEARIVVSAEDEVMVIVRDITERKRAEADIRNTLEKEKELSLLKSRFVTMASHEFRTPLTTILSSAELLQDYGSIWTEEKKLQHLQRIVLAVKHMTGLLDDVLLIGKAEAGKLEFNPTSLNLIDFCRELVEEIQSTTNKHTIVFRTQGDCNNSYMDEKLLRHIFSNLLSNAIKYSPQNETVNFTLIVEQGEAIFQVQDRGIGIPVTDQAQLFTSFHRASNVGTISGTGLGLAIVKRSVDTHGGRISMQSEVGKGTTFVVKLPFLP